MLSVHELCPLHMDKEKGVVEALWVRVPCITGVYTHLTW